MYLVKYHIKFYKMLTLIKQYACWLQKDVYLFGLTF